MMGGSGFLLAGCKSDMGDGMLIAAAIASASPPMRLRARGGTRPGSAEGLHPQTAARPLTARRTGGRVFFEPLLTPARIDVQSARWKCRRFSR
jgi:hypothetical protein